MINFSKSNRSYPIAKDRTTLPRLVGRCLEGGGAGLCRKKSTAQHTVANVHLTMPLDVLRMLSFDERLGVTLSSSWSSTELLRQAAPNVFFERAGGLARRDGLTVTFARPPLRGAAVTARGRARRVRSGSVVSRPHVVAHRIPRKCVCTNPNCDKDVKRFAFALGKHWSDAR